MADPQTLKPGRPSRAELLVILQGSRADLLALLQRRQDPASPEIWLRRVRSQPWFWSAGGLGLAFLAGAWLFRRKPKSSLAARRPIAKIAIRDLALPLVLTAARPYLQRFAEQRLAPYMQR